MYTKTLIAAGLIGLAQAQSYTPPSNATFGALYTPDGSHPVTQGQTFKVTWNPAGHTTDGSTISLVLCKGPSTNCVNAPNAIVSGIPASQAYYDWAVPCSLAPGVQSTETGYGMLIIVDGTGQFQYSTQFSVLAGASCGTTTSSTTSTTTTSKSSTTGVTTGVTTSSTTWGGWTSSSTANNYTTTIVKPTTPTSLKASTTAPTALTTAPVASPTPSQFHGAATKIGGSAAALVMAAGAAFFAL